MADTKTLAFEIGTEELPAFDLAHATKQLAGLTADALDSMRIPHGEVQVFSTPRRLIALVEAVALQTEALVEEHRGPSAAIAFDEQGAPTKAAAGFARGKGLDPDQLERREVDGTEYVFAVQNIAAQPTPGLLPQVLGTIIEGISWPKSCKWGTETALFSRPVRWLLALLGEEVIPVAFAGLAAGNTTCGHRFLSPGPHAVAKADELIGVLESNYVVPSEELREAVILNGIEAIERETGYRAELPPKTLTEVINLTEYPTPLVGTFEEAFLEVPEEIIVDAMLMHQRYFPLYDHEGRLTNRFIIVSNGDPAYSETIVDGNERVVRPRLSDAKFFYEEDLKHPLEYYVDDLDKVVFQESLGTMKDKTDRVVALAACLANDAGLADDEMQDVARAARLCKADLVSNAVVEFTSVQGIMGCYYAKASGENDRVAQAIADHYRPRFAGDAAPASLVGRVVAAADKLDTICGLFAVGQGPTGSSDPFALRRGAIGIINMLLDNLPISLEGAVEASLDTYLGIDFDQAEVGKEVIGFFVTRTKVMLRDEGYSADTVDAVLAVDLKEPSEIVARVSALEDARKDRADTMNDLATAYARANNLREGPLGADVDAALMGDAEKALYDAIGSVDARVAAALADNDYGMALDALAALRSPIDLFFEEVLIMDRDEALKNNRLRLLNRFVATFAHVADFGKMAKTTK